MNRQMIDASAVTDLVTLLLPVRGRSLLVPNVSVAEIMRMPELEVQENLPGWLRGLIAWRGLRIPLISFEALNDDPFAASSTDMRIAVLNGLSDGDKLPFYGILTQGSPRMLRLAQNEIVAVQGASRGPAESMVVNAAGEELVIPDLVWLEKQLLALVNSLDVRTEPVA